MNGQNKWILWGLAAVGVYLLYQQFSRRPVKRLVGGKYDPDELAMGIEVEAEHTDDLAERERIAKEHLDEHPDYYSRLKAAGL